MKVPPARAEAFADSPDPRLRAVLVYGGDAGLVRERAERLARAVAGDAGDPFRVARLTGSDAAEDPARLFDEAAGLSLTGGRRVVRVAEAGDAAAPAVRAVLEAGPGDALVVIEAGALPPRSALRRLCEGAENAAALPCYADEADGLERLVRETLADRDLVPDADALVYLCSRLGGDRGLIRQELEKLALYAGGDEGGADNGPPRTVGLAEAAAVVGDSAALTLDDAVFAAADGDAAGLDRALDRLSRSGVGAVTVLRAAVRHFQRLHLVAARVARGESAEAAMAALRPPVFFKVRDRFRRQLARWPLDRLGAALELLIEAEIQCKATARPENTLCSRALLALSGVRRRHTL